MDIHFLRCQHEIVLILPTTVQLDSAEVSVETSWSCSFTTEPFLDIKALP